MDAHYFPGVRDGRAPLVVAILVLVGAAVAAFVIGTPPRSARGQPAARAFLDQWERSRLATYYVRSDFTRTLPDGNQLKSTTTTVQDPPDNRLVIGFGSASGRLGGKIVRCAGTPDGGGGCITSTDAPDYQSEVDAEVQGLASYVTGDRPVYDVVDFGADIGPSGAHCFRLDLAVALPAPPYGNQALFCFDRATDAPALTEISRTEAVDLTVAREIRTDLRPEDLEVPTDRGPVVGTPSPGG
jgi:hypothetical protein